MLIPTLRVLDACWTRGGQIAQTTGLIEGTSRLLRLGQRPFVLGGG